MIQVVQDINPTHVRAPLLEDLRVLLKGVKAIPVGVVGVRFHGITVKELALVGSRPKQTHPMLSWQVDGIGVGNSTSWVRGLAWHLIGAVHVQEIASNIGILLTDVP